jgi:DNA-binding MarR family transcriptional regulator
VTVRRSVRPAVVRSRPSSSRAKSATAKEPAADPDRPPSWAGEAYLESVGLVARLLRIHLLFGRFLDEVTSAERINDTDYLVLALIERSPGGGSPSHIAEVLRRSTGGMTVTLDRLESLGWLNRAPDPADRRRIRLHLTDAGRVAIDRVRAALHGWEDGLGLDDDARAAAFRSADTLIGLLSQPRPAR